MSISRPHPLLLCLVAQAAVQTASLFALARTGGDIPTTDVPDLQRLLYDTAARPDEREQAAQRLLSRPDVAARNTIRSALYDSANLSAQLAAARALADRPTPDPSLVDPLLRLMDPQTGEPLLVAAGDALSAFKTDDAVLQRLIGLATAGDERVRAVAARTLGTFVDKRAAATLVTLTDPRQPPRVTTAAGMALAYLSGTEPGSVDAAGWRDWWARNQGKDEAGFRSDLAASRSLRYDRLRTTSDGFTEEVQRTLGDSYKRLPRDQQPDALLSYLRSGDPTFRTIGCRITYDAVQLDPTPPEPLKEQLRLLIGDAHAEVRRLTAKTLEIINDRPAAPALLTQLGQETDSRVRAAIADALRPIHDPRAVAPLLKLLDDPSDDTAQSAAEALADTLGDRDVRDKLAKDDPTALERAATKLRETLVARTTAQNDVVLRDDLVKALGPLRSGAAASVYRDMLASKLETPRVRRSVLTALGQLGDLRWIDSVTDWIKDGDSRTRQAAVKALGEMSPNLGDYEQILWRRLNPVEEKDPDVRDETWRVLTKLFAKASTQKLAPWEKRLTDDPAKLLVVLRQERDNQRRDGHGRDAAEKDCQVGDLSDGLGQYKDAMDAFQRAFDYADASSDPTLLRRASIGRTHALLQNRQYDDAINFAEAQINRDKSLKTDLGPEIRRTADALMQKERNYEAADQLIGRALRMNPGLGPLYTDDLQRMQTAIQQRPREHNLRPDGPGGAVEEAWNKTSPRRAV